MATSAPVSFPWEGGCPQPLTHERGTSPCLLEHPWAVLAPSVYRWGAEAQSSDAPKGHRLPSAFQTPQPGSLLGLAPILGRQLLPSRTRHPCATEPVLPEPEMASRAHPASSRTSGSIFPWGGLPRSYLIRPVGLRLGVWGVAGLALEAPPLTI